jgi:hypothetical protein
MRMSQDLDPQTETSAHPCAVLKLIDTRSNKHLHLVRCQETELKTKCSFRILWLLMFTPAFIVVGPDSCRKLCCVLKIMKYKSQEITDGLKKVQGALCPGMKRAEPGADHSPPCNAKVNKD